MIPKTSPEVSGAIRARLYALRNRKAMLDEAIASLERYAACSRRPGAAVTRRSRKAGRIKGAARWAGAT